MTKSPNGAPRLNAVQGRKDIIQHTGRKAGLWISAQSITSEKNQSTIRSTHGEVLLNEYQY